MGARPVEEEKGVDGKILFRDHPDPKQKPQSIVFSVKGGGTGVKDVRDLDSVVAKTGAAKRGFSPLVPKLWERGRTGKIDCGAVSSPIPGCTRGVTDGAECFTLRAMNRKHLVLVIVYVGSLGIAYWMGGGSSPVRELTPPVTAEGSATVLPPKEKPEAVSRGEDAAEEGKGGKKDVHLLIAKARLEFGSGMGGMMNIRGMLRAIAPIAELDDSQIQEALTEVEKTVREPQQKMMFYSLLLGQWAETDGPGAMKYAQTKMDKGSMMNMGITSSVLGTWAHKDPEAVWKWMQTEGADDGNEQTHRMAVTAVFAGLAANNLDSALARAGSLDEQSRSMALSGIAASAGDGAGRQRLLDRTGSLPAEQRNTLRQQVASQWAMSDPDAAVAWIHSLPADEQKPVRDQAAQMMLMMKPAAGAELMLEGVEEKDRPQVYDRVVMQWANQDARAAGEWLQKQPQGPELDNARMSYARSIAQRDPAAAMDWARSVQNEKQRPDSIGTVYQMWRGKDPAGAEAALNASGLSAEQVKAIREGPKRTQGEEVAVPTVRSDGK